MRGLLGILLCLCPLIAEASGWVITETRIKTRTVIRSEPQKVRLRWNIRGNWNPTEAETRQHLERDHKTFTDGMTHQQMLDLHDGLHQGRVRTVLRQDIRVRSSCPGGVCPPQQRFYRVR